MGVGHFNCGTVDFPLHPDILSDRVQELGFPALLDGSEAKGRVEEAALKALPEEKLVLRDAPELQPAPLTRVGAHMSCDQKHFGFCEHDHRDIADAVRRIYAWLSHCAAHARRHRRDEFSVKHMLLSMEAGDESLCMLYIRSLRQVTTGQQLD
eukprot:1884394-Pyramimonas_sp.AAC.1